PSPLPLLIRGLLSPPPPEAKRFPRPSCGWVSAAAVSRALGEPVRATGGGWTNKSAPMLTCSYDELTPTFQLEHVPILRIQYAENQYYRKVPGARPLRGVARCVVGAPLFPKRGVAAWTLTKMRLRKLPNGPPLPMTTTSPVPPPGP